MEPAQRRREREVPSIYIFFQNYFINGFLIALTKKFFSFFLKQFVLKLLQTRHLEGSVLYKIKKNVFDSSVTNDCFYIFEHIFSDRRIAYFRQKNALRSLDRSSHQRCSVRRGVLKHFTKFTGKHPYWSQACNFIKKETPAKVFSCEFCEIFKNTVLQNSSRPLLLYVK